MKDKIKKIRTVCFISGRGSNLRSLITKANDYEILSVLSNKEDAPGLQIAKEHNIPTFAAVRSSVSSLREQKELLYKKAISLKPDYIILAGYMQIVTKEFIHEFQNRILNIHPSLLPAYPGLDTHKRALADKASIHGCTVHLVIPEVDAGAIIAQAQCEIPPQATEEELAQLVLKNEHRIYPWVLNALGRKAITISSTGEIVFTKKALEDAEQLKFITSSRGGA